MASARADKGQRRIQEDIDRVLEGARRPDEPAWQLSAAAYQHKAGVRQPWISEISGTQFARMSRARQDQYQHQRYVEWGASSAIKDRWADEVWAAYQAGEFGKSTPNAHAEAVGLVWARIRADKAALKELAFQQALAANQDACMADVGDRVYDLMSRRYGTVVRKFKKSLRLQFAEPLYHDRRGVPQQEGSLNLYAVQWLSYDDLKARFEEGYDGGKAAGLAY